MNHTVLMPVSADFVTAAITVPGMAQVHPHLETETGIGPVIYATGQPPRERRFPTDNDPRDKPAVEKVPFSNEELIAAVHDASLPEQEAHTPVSGYLYFAYSAKLKNIKHLQLQYSGSLGTAVLVLR